MKKVYLYDKVGDKILFKKVVVADSFLKRIKGLTGRKEMLDDEVMVFYRCNWVHTFFMKMNIDVIYLDSTSRIAKVCKDVPPKTFLPPVLNATIVMECKAGTMERLAVGKGDILEIK